MYDARLACAMRLRTPRGLLENMQKTLEIASTSNLNGIEISLEGVKINGLGVWRIQCSELRIDD